MNSIFNFFQRVIQNTKTFFQNFQRFLQRAKRIKLLQGNLLVNMVGNNLILFLGFSKTDQDMKYMQIHPKTDRVNGKRDTTSHFHFNYAFDYNDSLENQISSGLLFNTTEKPFENHLIKYIKERITAYMNLVCKDALYNHNYTTDVLEIRENTHTPNLFQIVVKDNSNLVYEAKLEEDGLTICQVTDGYVKFNDENSYSKAHISWKKTIFSFDVFVDTVADYIGFSVYSQVIDRYSSVVLGKSIDIVDELSDSTAIDLQLDPTFNSHSVVTTMCFDKSPKETITKATADVDKILSE